MSLKGYKQRTRRLGIPVVDYDDRIMPELELKKYQIIENMLLAGLRGAVNSVFDEGDMNVARGEDGKWRVTLSATGANSSATGTVGGAYFEAPSSVAWEGLEDGCSYFLYLRGTSKTFESPSEVRAVVSPRRLLDGASVLLARVDLAGDKGELDRDPDGKLHARDVARHVTEQENPHGERVVQDDAMVRRTLAFGKDAKVAFESESGPVEVPASALAEAAGRTRRVVDFVSAGPAGAVLEGGGKVAFVSVSRRVVGEPGWGCKAGEVAVGYFGEDPEAERPDQFVVRNSMDEGIPMRAIVFCG